MPHQSIGKKLDLMKRNSLKWVASLLILAAAASGISLKKTDLISPDSAAALNDFATGHASDNADEPATNPAATSQTNAVSYTHLTLPTN